MTLIPDNEVERSSVIATGAQIREGRRLLRWGSAFLARKAKISLQVLVEAQNGAGLSPIDPVSIHAAISAAQRVLETGGIEFAAGGSEGPGVRLRKAEN